MSTNLKLINHENEEGYFDMELSSSKTSEFEFQMSFSCSDEKAPENDASPADDLFYRGKLLPLHHPPRQKMVEELAVEIAGRSHCRSKYPSGSRRLSCDQNPRQDCDFFEISGDLRRFINNCRPEKKPLSEKLKLVKRSSVAYLKSLFAKGGRNLSKDEALWRKCFKTPIRANFGGDKNINVHRKSFSGTIRRHSPTKCLSSSSSDSASSSSSSFSLRSNGQLEVGSFRRSNSGNEIESSIDAAIAHCKRSLQIYSAANSGEDDEQGKKAMPQPYMSL